MKTEFITKAQEQAQATKDFIKAVQKSRALMALNESVKKLKSDLDNGRKVTAVVGRKILIDGYRQIPKEDLPDFLQNVPSYANDHVGYNLIFVYDQYRHGTIIIDELKTP